MDQFAQILWQRSNPSSEVPSYTVVETSVTGNMAVTEMEARRIQWKTTSSRVPKTKPVEENDSITVQPQQIRVFVIEFTPQ